MKCFTIITVFLLVTNFVYSQDFLVFKQRSEVISYIIDHAERKPSDSKWTEQSWMSWVDKKGQLQSVSFNEDGICKSQSFELNKDEASKLFKILFKEDLCAVYDRQKSPESIRLKCRVNGELYVSFTDTPEGGCHIYAEIVK